MAKRSLVLLSMLLVCSAATFAAAPPAGWSSDDQLAAMNERIPGFGGTFVGSDGRVAVYLQHPDTQRATLEKAVGGGATVLQGDYEFRDLVSWKRALRPLLAMPGVTSLDANEMLNRVQVGIDPKATAAQRADVEARLAALGVPAAAVHFAGQTTMSPMPLIVRDDAREAKGKGTTLQSHFVPQFPAGVQINWRIDSAFVGICTIGFVAKQGATTGLVTNRHCTNVEGAVDRTHYRQGGFSDPFVATEVKDPGFFVGGDCPEGRRCRNSDSIFAKLDGKAGKPTAELKKIAKTAKSSPSRGSLTVNPTTARFTIVGRQGDALAGEDAQKVGRTTGWTHGPILETCVDVNVSEEDVTNICQTVVLGGSDHGDSGSPVFLLQNAKGSSTTSPPVRAIGLMWGGGQISTGQTVFVYSPLAAVDLELGPVGVN